MVETTGTVVHLKMPFNATRITASTIECRVQQLAKENSQSSGKAGFWEEFEVIYFSLNIYLFVLYSLTIQISKTMLH